MTRRLVFRLGILSEDRKGKTLANAPRNQTQVISRALAPAYREKLRPEDRDRLK